jgi:hypothetical protein
MITVRLEYSGMRATRTAPDMSTATAQATDMFARHGIDRTTIVGDATAPDYWRGQVRLTGARAIVRFIDDRADGADGEKTDLPTRNAVAYSERMNNISFAVGDIVRPRYGSNIDVWTGAVVAVENDGVKVQYGWGVAAHAPVALLKVSDNG